MSFENIVGKGEIARNEQFLLFPWYFLPVSKTFCHFHQIWHCCLQTLSVWKSLKFVVLERFKLGFELQVNPFCLVYFQKIMFVYQQTLLSQTREKQASTLSEVTWLGRTVPVKTEAVRLFLLNLQESSREIEETEGIDNKISIYESVLKQCIDAQQALRDTLLDDQVSWDFGVSFS